MVVGVLVLAFVAAQTCQKDQVRVSKEQAIATAERRIDFEPTRTQIRLLRQGLNSKPNWIVSMSVPIGEIESDRFSELAVVRIDANTGEVLDVQIER